MSSVALAAGAAAQEATPQPPAANPPIDINPYDRDIEITAPLQFNRRILGELPVLLTRDDRFMVGRDGFLALIGPLLTPEARTDLASQIGQRERFLPEEVATLGINLDYDPEQLAVLVLKISPEKRSVEELFTVGGDEAPGARPEPFSAYLNVNSTVSRLSRAGSVRTPELFLNGAIRYRNLVLEADAQSRRDFVSDKYKVERRYARLVYDQPEQARRWFVGDLDPETRGRQGFFNMGGVGLVRQRRRFDSFRSNVLSGGRQLILQEQSTVRVIRNGLFQREFTLDPGQYDISNLPLDTGSNDIEIEVQGISGSRESYQYRAYLDTIDLEPGDHEYGAFLGFLDDGAFGNPDYSEKTPVFTGFWRKAFFNRPAIGLGIQLSEQTQNLTGQTQFLLPNSGRLQLDVGLSEGDFGTGYAATIGYDQIVGGASGYDTLSVVVDYTSTNYTTVGGIGGVSPISWNLAAAYTKRLTHELFVTTNASYRRSRSDLLRHSYSIATSANYRFHPKWMLQVGAEYVKSGFSSGLARGDGIGVTIGLIWQPRYNQRAETRYSSVRDIGSARFQQTADNAVGSFGYGFTANRTSNSTSLGGQLDYVGNRFDANVTHTAFGTGFDNITDNHITTMRVGTSVAYAGGQVAMGRAITDSFALVHPHKTLGAREVIVGDSLEGGRYVSASGTFGPAVQNNLSAFLNQSIRYDVLDPPRGYDIGEGVKRVRPAYKSGYVIEVGSDAFVSAMGRLQGPDGQAIKLVSGTIRTSGSDALLPEPFFTNTTGRFAIAKLKPGVEYVVQFQGGGSFSFEVPDDNEGLLDLGTISIGRGDR